MTRGLRTERDPEGGVERHRPRLLGLAYRMLGDVEDAEDVVQDAYLRWHGRPRDDIRSPEAWLVTVATRLAVDRLRRAAADRERYVGPWLPEPIATDAGTPAPDHGAELASDLSLALLVLLESLAPEERAGFLLREVFGTDYTEIARILERRPDAVRQMVHRARLRVQAGRPRVAAAPGERERLLERFLAALAVGDAAGLLALLAPDVTVTTDGGGVVTAARRRITGADKAARFLLGVTRKFGGDSTWRIGRLNGEPALLNFREEVLRSATAVAMEGGRIRAIHSVMNPAKLERALHPTLDIE